MFVGLFSASDNLSNSAVFPPCNVDVAIESFQQFEMKIKPRTEFVERFSRSRLIQRMSEDVIATRQ